MGGGAKVLGPSRTPVSLVLEAEQGERSHTGQPTGNNHGTNGSSSISCTSPVGAPFSICSSQALTPCRDQTLAIIIPSGSTPRHHHPATIGTQPLSPHWDRLPPTVIPPGPTPGTVTLPGLVPCHRHPAGTGTRPAAARWRHGIRNARRSRRPPAPRPRKNIPYLSDFSPIFSGKSLALGDFGKKDKSLLAQGKPSIPGPPTGLPAPPGLRAAPQGLWL